MALLSPVANLEGRAKCFFLPGCSSRVEGVCQSGEHDYYFWIFPP